MKVMIHALVWTLSVIATIAGLSALMAWIVGPPFHPDIAAGVAAAALLTAQIARLEQGQ